MALVTMDSAENSYVVASDLDLCIPCYCEENAWQVPTIATDDDGKDVISWISWLSLTKTTEINWASPVKATSVGSSQCN